MLSSSMPEEQSQKMATITNLVTFEEEAAARMGTPPMLEPQPNAKNTRALIKTLTDAVQDIPSYQLTG